MRVARFEYVGLSVIGVIAFLLIRAVRWRYMLDNDVPWHTVLHIQNIGYLLTNILPFRDWGCGAGRFDWQCAAGHVGAWIVHDGCRAHFGHAVYCHLVALYAGRGRAIAANWMRAGARVSGILAISAIVLLIIAANKRPLTLKTTGWLLKKVRFLDAEAWLTRIDDLTVGLSSLTQLRKWPHPAPVEHCYLDTHPHLLSSCSPVCQHPAYSRNDRLRRLVAAALSIALPSSPGQIGVFHAGVIGALQVLGQPEAASASFAFLYHALNLSLMVLSGLVGIYGTGATFGQIVASTQSFITNRKTNES